MPNAIRAYVTYVEKMNRFIGRFSMYLIFAMLAVLLYSSFAKGVLGVQIFLEFDELHTLPAQWCLETAQFVMVAYYLLGGGYSMQLGDHVRMDLLYSNWKPRTRSLVDSVTILFLIFYLCLLLYGGYSSTSYAIEYGEQSYSAWAPYMAPVKIVMTFGVFLMLMQALATLFKDIAALRGEEL